MGLQVRDELGRHDGHVVLIRAEAAGEDLEEKEFFVGETQLVELSLVAVDPFGAAVDDRSVEPIAEVLDAALDAADSSILGRFLLARKVGIYLADSQMALHEKRGRPLGQPLLIILAVYGLAPPPPFFGHSSTSHQTSAVTAPPAAP